MKPVTIAEEAFMQPAQAISLPVADSRSSTKAAMVSSLENWLSDTKLSAEQSSFTLTGAGDVSGEQARRKMHKRQPWQSSSRSIYAWESGSI